MDIYSWLQRDDSFHLIQMTPDLVKTMENNERLIFKSRDRDSSIFLCSDSKTFHIRKKNHSNTVIVLKHDKENAKAIGFASMDSELEPKVVSGSIDISDVPLFEETGEEFTDFVKRTNPPSFADLRAVSTASKTEFDVQWAELNGCEIDGHAVILGFNLVVSVLKTIITTLVAYDMDQEAFSATKLQERLEDIRPEFARTVLAQFATKTPAGYSLDKPKISRWFGLQVLRSTLAPVKEEDFLINWKDAFPAFFDVSIDIQSLVGSFVRPFPNMVQFYNSAGLPQDPVQRFKELFKIQASWSLEEMKPYVEDLNSRNLKLESFVMKYARRKRIGKNYVITRR
ncbi:unnamed protein product [Kuraishia capsulata CBS 1993]|uniref:Sister chromatid cohesion protein DCC1 n=1 Tax=Kuraishia capsulata CBS 1993 TaxID=1382522 RepID=W6MWL8_9ASCO|nr:uncharacterized protein KUCA_T00003614001 [Kuraishia capsulata CBS 1993]CDK27635.1 unnamed protein product [Kuraishia capsulata CBS 1993]